MLRVLCQWWKCLVELRLFVNDGNEEKHSSGSAKAPCQWQWRKNNYSFRSAQASGEAADRRRLLPLPRLCLSLSCCQCLIEGRAVNNGVAVSKVTAGWFQWQGVVSEINSLTLSQLLPVRDGEPSYHGNCCFCQDAIICFAPKPFWEPKILELSKGSPCSIAISVPNWTFQVIWICL